MFCFHITHAQAPGLRRGEKSPLSLHPKTQPRAEARPPNPPGDSRSRRGAGQLAVPRGADGDCWHQLDLFIIIEGKGSSVYVKMARSCFQLPPLTCPTPLASCSPARRPRRGGVGPRRTCRAQAAHPRGPPSAAIDPVRVWEDRELPGWSQKGDGEEKMEAAMGLLGSAQGLGPDPRREQQVKGRKGRRQRPPSGRP